MIFTFLSRVAHSAFTIRSWVGVATDALNAAAVAILFSLISGPDLQPSHFLSLGLVWLIVFSILRFAGACYRVWESDYLTILSLQNRLLDLRAGTAAEARPEEEITPRDYARKLISALILERACHDLRCPENENRISEILAALDKAQLSRASKMYRDDVSIWHKNAMNYDSKPLEVLSEAERVAKQYIRDHAVRRVWRALQALQSDLCGAREHFLPYKNDIELLDEELDELLRECEAEGFTLTIAPDPVQRSLRVG